MVKIWNADIKESTKTTKILQYRDAFMDTIQSNSQTLVLQSDYAFFSPNNFINKRVPK